jgi:hypothetical protein
MNGSIYMQWLNNRLLVAFNKRYPRQKMVLVLGGCESVCRLLVKVSPNSSY